MIFYFKFHYDLDNTSYLWNKGTELIPFKFHYDLDNTILLNFLKNIFFLFKFHYDLDNTDEIVLTFT